MAARRVARSIVLGAMAVGGLIGAHVLDYVIVEPHHDNRIELLARTGHGYLSPVTHAAVILTFVALLAAFAYGFARGRSKTLAHPRLVTFAAVLVPLQVGGFLVLELAERLLAGRPAFEMFGSLLLLGIALQAIVALLAAFLLFLLDRAGLRLGSAAPARYPTVGVARVWILHVTDPVVTRWAARPFLGRAPPASPFSHA